MEMESIRWEDHSSDLSSSVAKLYKNVEFTDCVLDTDGGLLKAHRVILAACSPYIKNLLVAYNTMVTIPLKEIKYGDMKLLLDFMYYGEVNVPIADISSFVKTVKYFQVTSLNKFDSNFVGNFSCNDGVSEHEHGMNANFGDTKLSECIDKLKAIDVGKHSFDVKSNLEVEASILISSIEKDILDEDGEKLVNHLKPVSLVAVSVCSENVEEQGDKSFMCRETEFKNSLKEYRYGRDLTKEAIVKRESNLETGLGMQIGFEEEMKERELHFPSMDNTSVSQTQKNNSCSNNIPFNKRDEVFVRSTDLEVSFEAVGDMPAHDVKEEKLCEGGDFGNALKLKSEPLTEMGQREDVSPSANVCEEMDAIAPHNSTGMKLMEKKIVSQFSRMNLVQVQRSNENSVVDETYGSSFKGITPHGGEGKKLKERVGEKRTVRDTLPDVSFNAKKQNKNQHSLQMKSFHVHSSDVQNKSGLTGKEQTHSAKRRSGSFHQESNEMLTRYQMEMMMCGINEILLDYKHRSGLTGKEKTHSAKRSGSFNQKSDEMLSCYEMELSDREMLKALLDHKHDLTVRLQKHSCKKPFQCKICKHSFTVKHHLTDHMRTHTGEKPFRCANCESSFSQKSSLKNHMLTHTEEKQFRCEICKKSFSRHCNLNRHKLTHSTGTHSSTP